MRLVALLGTLPAIYSCSPEKSPSWPSVMTSIPQGAAVYSLSFTGPPPEGTIVNLAVFPGATAKASCDYFRNLSLPADFWYLRAEVARIEKAMPAIVRRQRVLGEALAIHSSDPLPSRFASAHTVGSVAIVAPAV